jgi:general secretion pathway protein F
MSLFAYQALHAGGKSRKGVIDAQSLHEAKERLRQQGVMVTRIQEKRSRGNSGDLNRNQLLQFTVQLSRLIQCRVPLFDSLQAIEEQSREEGYGSVILGICNRIQAGDSLSNAMRSYPKSFHQLYCAMISAGELSGSLDTVLDKLAQLLDKQMKLRKQMSTALIYPAVLVVFCLAVTSFLLTFTVPSIENLFSDQQVNGFTLVVMGASHLLRSWWWLLLLGFGASVASLFYYARTKHGKSKLHLLSLRLPVVKQLVTQSTLARFARTVGTLQESGVNLIDSLQLARGVLIQPQFEECMIRAEQRIIEGGSLSRELRKEPLIPTLATRMLAIGEESGEMAPMFHRIADLYEEDVEKSITRLVALAQPVILVVMGAIIGVVMLAILLPMTDMSSFFN